jgi:hypothetical protein
MIALVALLAVAAPDAVIVVPDPQASLPKAARTLAWLGKSVPDLEPKRVADRSRELFGFDLLSATELDRIGVKPGAPLTIRALPDLGVALIELPISDQRKAHAAVESAMKLHVTAQPLGGGSGFVAGPATRAMVLMHRTPDKLWLAAGDAASASWGARTATVSNRTIPDWNKDRRLAPITKAMKKTLPRPAKDLTSVPRSADAWAVIGPSRGVDRVEAAVFFDDRGFEVRADVNLDVGAEVALLESARTRTSHRLLANASQLAISAEASAALTGSGTRRLLEELGLPTSHASALSGDAQIALAKDGSLLFAMEVSGHADGAGGLLAKIRERREKPKAELFEVPGKRPVLVAWLGPAPKEAVLASVLASDRAERPALSMSVDPRSAFEALEARGRHGDGIGPRPMDTVFLRFALRPLLDSTDLVRLEATAARAPRARVIARVEHR